MKAETQKSRHQSAKSSKRYPFIAEHRGGPLTKANHRKLMEWAIACSEHVLFLIDNEIDERLHHALDVARQWKMGLVPTGVAMKASLGAHAVARETANPVCQAVARSIGQTVATAHMADHSPGGAFYALRAVKRAHRDVEAERRWQMDKLRELPPEIVEIVLAMWKDKELDRRI